MMKHLVFQWVTNMILLATMYYLLHQVNPHLPCAVLAYMLIKWPTKEEIEKAALEKYQIQHSTLCRKHEEYQKRQAENRPAAGEQ